MHRIIRELRAIRHILERAERERPRRLWLQATAISGGLEATGVLRVRAEFRNTRGQRRSTTIIVKRLQGRLTREAAIYETLVAAHARDLAPRLLGVEHRNRDQSILFLEWVPRVNAWPWRNLRAAEELVGRLARLHVSTAAADAGASLPEWDYENELKEASERTLELLARTRRHAEFSGLAGQFAAARRLVTALPNMRRELLGFSPLGTLAIHGDLHPGNVLVRRRAGMEEPILIDWGRARRGSPLEDVSAWLQSLAYWEPQVRRPHDTLLSMYLSGRGMGADC